MLKQWVVIDHKGAVVHGFDAAEDQIPIITAREENPWPKGSSVLDVSDLPERPLPGWRLDKKDGWVAPPVQVLTKEQADRNDREIADREKNRVADEAFLVKAADTLRKGGKLTESERDRVAVIRATRGVAD